MEQDSISLFGEARILLLATDGSSFSDGAIQEAIFICQARNARLIVLHVFKIDAEAVSAAHSLLLRQQEIEPHISQLRKMADDSGITIEVLFISASDPAKAIVEQARLHHADVIIMGRHGKAARMSLLVGSMTAKVISQGFPQVLVVPKDFMISGKHVLLAVDDSPNSAMAARELLSIGQRCQTLQRVTVMSVVKHPADLPQAQKLVNEVCQRNREEGLKASCEPLALVGNVVDSIVQFADDEKVDMILVGGRGRKNSMAKMLMGHVTENVIGLSPCAVLVVTA
ncbi:MAG: universal stress protein [Desulfobulbaceae bacterium]|jgi:nucleotide-binding universal stress UspA family protein|nr:universal stress protein [Desulfobulbaceae bacterium]